MHFTSYHVHATESYPINSNITETYPGLAGSYSTMKENPEYASPKGPALSTLCSGIAIRAF